MLKPVQWQRRYLDLNLSKLWLPLEGSRKKQKGRCVCVCIKVEGSGYRILTNWKW